MKENDNVCPCCGQKIPEKPKRYLFKEQWEEDALSKKLDLCKRALDCLANPYTMSICEECNHAPHELLDWIRKTKPKVKRDEFTVQLAQRVEHLESLLREKGVEI